MRTARLPHRPNVTDPVRHQRQVFRGHLLDIAFSNTLPPCRTGKAGFTLDIGNLLLGTTLARFVIKPAGQKQTVKDI